MDKCCSYCAELIRSSFSVEPHHYLNIVRHSPGSSIYRCKVCDTMFEFTEHDIFLLDVTVEKKQEGHSNHSACA